MLLKLKHEALMWQNV